MFECRFSISWPEVNTASLVGRVILPISAALLGSLCLSKAVCVFEECAECVSESCLLGAIVEMWF